MARLSPESQHTPPSVGASTNANDKRLGLLLALGVVLIGIWVAGLLAPASVFRYNEPITRNVPFNAILGESPAGFGRYLVVLALLWATFVAAVSVAKRLRSNDARKAAVVITLLLTVVALFVYPGGSRDIWHNIADGRLLWLYSRNPLLTTPGTIGAEDPLIRNEAGFIAEPSYYGPLWYLLTMAPTLLAQDGYLANLLAFKLLPAVFFLLGLPLAHRTAETLKPGSGSVALVIYGWNPLLLMSSVVDGHNDVVMSFFVILGVFLMLKGRWETAIPAVVAGALVKYVAIILLPVVVIAAMKRDGRAAVPRIGMGFLLGTLLAVFAWLPFWAGTETLAGIRAGGDRAINSLMAVALYWLEPDRIAADLLPPALALVFAIGFLCIYAGILLRYFHSSNVTARAMITTCIAVILAYLLIQSWWFFPWYVCWIVPLGAVLVTGRASTLTLVFAASSMTVSAIFGWRGSLFGEDLFAANAVAVLCGMGPPLLLLAAWAFRRRHSGEHANSRALI